MANYLTQQQRVAAVKHYYQSQGNGAEAARRLAFEFDIRTVQGRNITNIVKKFEQTGSVNDAPKPGRPVSSTTTEKGDELVASVRRSPQKSTRRLSLELDISQASVLRLLKERNLKPYIPRLFHALADGDTDRRMEFAEIFLNKVKQDRNFIDNIWWSDEATFKLNGHINRHNCVYWAEENPHVVIERDVNLPGVIVWGALSSYGLIGPYFFDGTVNSQNYLQLLQTELWPKIKNQSCYFQQDGAPPHYAICVRNWLNEHLPGKWIGRRGPTEFPARSPDLTPMDFFLWGVLKDSVYRLKPRSLDALRKCIRDSFLAIDADICKTACRSVAIRLQDCIEANGEHFECYRT